LFSPKETDLAIELFEFLHTLPLPEPHLPFLSIGLVIFAG